VGSSWRGHYERLHLHTPKNHSALPFLDYPSSYPRYPSREQVVAYLDEYARAFDIQPHFGQDVVRCTPTAGDGWEVETQAATWRGRHLVVATGFNRVPCMPVQPGRDSFAGSILHSRDYVNGEPFRGKRVLVVGFGNSGAEIALDLWEHGAHPAISARGEVNVIPREVLGIPVTQLALAGRYLPPRMADRVNALMIRLAIGDLTRHGIRKRPDGPFIEVLEHRQVPVIDVGTVALIRRGLVQMRPAITCFDQAEVCFADGRRESYDAVILQQVSARDCSRSCRTICRCWTPRGIRARMGRLHRRRACTFADSTWSRLGSCGKSRWMRLALPYRSVKPGASESLPSIPLARQSRCGMMYFLQCSKDEDDESRPAQSDTCPRSTGVVAGFLAAQAGGPAANLS